MTAVLCRHFGLKHIAIAEDIASDTFLKASEHWAVNGVPENPEAWLYTVAKNKTKDYFRRLSVLETKIRTELCSEAMRLTLLLTEDPLTNPPKTHALLALMCFQSSRLGARTNASGESVLFGEQDKTLWDASLIQRGNYYLVNATDGNEISKYHLEAGVAYWHTTAGEHKWPHILQLYNQLVLMEYSPVTALNRGFALAQVYGNEKAIREVEKLNLTGNTYYHQLLGYLYADTNRTQSIEHYVKAIWLTRSDPEKQTLKNALKQLRA